jgi:hypothetical protein
LAAGGVRCWGLAFANGSDTDELTPSVVNDSPSVAIGNITQVATGGIHSCARSANGGIQCWGRNPDGQLGNGNSNFRGLAEAATVPSFLFNIDPNVVINRDGKKAQVIVLANCDAGALAHIDVELRQGNDVGEAHDTVKCTGALERYPVKVNASGRDRFSPGAAQANAEAVVKQGHGQNESQQWTRSVAVTVGQFVD